MRANRLRDNQGWTSVGTGEDLAPKTVLDRLRDGAVWLLVVLGWIAFCIPLALMRGAGALRRALRGAA